MSAKLTKDNAPASNLAVTIKYSGDAKDSKLATTATTTGTDGRFYLNVIAGAQDATFRFTATANDANAASVDIVVDGTGPANPTGKYDMATKVNPLSFMNPDTAAYANLYNILNVFAAPDKLLTEWKEYDSATKKTTTIDRCSNLTGLWATACVFKIAIPNLVIGIGTRRS